MKPIGKYVVIKTIEEELKTSSNTATISLAQTQQKLQKQQALYDKMIQENESLRISASDFQNRLQTEKTQHNELKTQLVDALTMKQALKKQCEELQSTYTSRNSELIAVQRELETLKQLHDKTTDDKDLFIAKYEESLNTLQKNSEKFTSMGTMLRKFIEKYNDTKDRLKTLRAEFESILTEKSELSKRIADAEEIHKQSHHHLSLIEEKNKKIGSLRQEQKNYQNQANTLRNQLRESDYNIRSMQKHFTKKLKEAASLQDVSEKQKSQILSMERDIASYQDKISNFEESMQQLSLQEEKNRVQLEEKMRTAETKAKKLEENYWATYKELQIKDMHIVELEKIKGEFLRLQELLNNLRGFLPNHMLVPPTQTPTPQQHTTVPSFGTPLTPPPSSTATTDLFSITNTQQPKNNLF